MSQPAHCIDPLQANYTPTSLIRDTAVALLSLALFYAAAQSLLALHCLAVGAVAVVMAWQISSHRGEGIHFHRRLLAEGVALEGSLFQRILLRQFLVRLVLGSGAFMLSIALLALGQVMPRQYWFVLTLDALLLPFLAHLIRRFLAGQIKTEALRVFVGQRPVLLLNAGLVGTAFMVADFLGGAPDTRNQNIGDVFSSGLAEFVEHASCGPVGLICGILEGIDRSAWHIRQVVVPLLPTESMRYAGWAITLFGSLIIGVGFTWLLLGSMLPGSSPGKRLNRGPQASLALVIAGIAAATYLLTYATSWKASAGFSDSRQPSSPVMIDPCSRRSDLVVAEEARLSNALAHTRNTATANSEQLLRSGTANLFRAAEPNVEHYLDWYYSLTGSNTRLAMAASGKLAELLSDRLMATLFPAGLDAPMTDLARRAVNDSAALFEQFGAQYAAALRASIQAEPCLRRVVDASWISNFEHDLKRSGSAVTLGAVAGWRAWKGIAGQAGTRIAKAVAGRTAVRAVTAQAGKAAASRSASLIGAGGAAMAFCAPGGPLAIACGLGVGIASWLGADYLLIKGDELLNREEHRRELLQALAELERDLANGLVGAQGQLVHQLASDARSVADGIFVPARDGV